MSFEYASTILLGLFVVLILRLLRFAPEATPRKEKNLRRKADSNITHSYIGMFRIKSFLQPVFNEIMDISEGTLV